MQLSIAIATLAMIASMSSTAQPGQKPMTPTAPGTSGDPAWQGTVRLSDGRIFVTDGGLAIEAALAKPAKLPDRELAGKILGDYLTAPYKDEVGIRDLTAAVTGRTYTSPSGIAMNANYINFLRRIVPAASLRLRMTAPRQPVVVVAGGKAVGVLMPVAQ
jgi:hypothetical protein